MPIASVVRGSYKKKKNMRQVLLSIIVFFTTAIFGQTKQELSNFVPKGFVISEKITGDLNKDGLTDCVLLIKGTD
jgi:hypothetical protein